LQTHFLLTSTAFSPTLGERDEDHPDFINPGLYALELGDFLAAALAERGYPVRARCQEDWGHWIELDHAGGFTLAVGCSNTGDALAGEPEHRVFVEPDQPFVRKLFRKIDVRSEVEALGATVRAVLEASPLVRNLRLEDAA
jgi:hypothetical protein